MRPGVPDCTRPTSAGSRPSPCRRSTRPLVPKLRIDLPRRRVDRLEVVVDLEDQAAIAPVRALPVVDAAAGDAAQAGVNPALLAGQSRRARRASCSSPARTSSSSDDDRVELVDVVVADRIGPGRTQAGDVLRRDLGQVDELRRVGAAAVVGPAGRARLSRLATPATAQTDRGGERERRGRRERRATDDRHWRGMTVSARDGVAYCAMFCADAS